MILFDHWWHRRRWTVTFVMLALVLGSAIGVVSEGVISLQAPHGYRATFYLELFFAAVAAVVLVSLLVSRATAGLAVLVAVLPPPTPLPRRDAA